MGNKYIYDLEQVLKIDTVSLVALLDHFFRRGYIYCVMTEPELLTQAQGAVWRRLKQLVRR